MAERKYICKFCGEELTEKHMVVAKKNLSVCEECINILHNIILDRKEAELQKKVPAIPSPRLLKEKLDEYVIEQEQAKKIISVAVYNHYKRISHTSKTEIQKSNICLLGPTGCGKTLIAKTIAKLLEVPLVIVDSTSLTQVGYVGRSVSDIMLDLIQEANEDIKLAEKGIVFIDEIDKIAGKESTSGRDVAGEGVQQGLLKMIEGAKLSVSADKHLFGDEKTYEIDTSNILFIVGGSFTGIEKLIAKRLNKKQVGFGVNTDRVKTDNLELLHKVSHDDLISFGIIPELIGRIPILAVLDNLNEASLIRILTEPKNALTKQYTELLSYDNVELNFDDSAIKKIANIAIKRKSGARGLKSIVENSLLDLMYLGPSKKKKQVTIKDSDIIDKFTL